MSLKFSDIICHTYNVMYIKFKCLTLKRQLLEISVFVFKVRVLITNSTSDREKYLNLLHHQILGVSHSRRARILQFQVCRKSKLIRTVSHFFCRPGCVCISKEKPFIFPTKHDLYRVINT